MRKAQSTPHTVLSTPTRLRATPGRGLRPRGARRERGMGGDYPGGLLRAGWAADTHRELLEPTEGEGAFLVQQQLVQLHLAR